MAKKAEDPRKKKDARAKKALLLLVPVLVALVALQGPKVLKQVRGQSTAAPPATTAPAEPAAPSVAPGAPAPTAPTDTAPVAPAEGTAVAISDTATLSDTDAPPPADEGQLVAFSRFEARDPFVPLITEAPTGTETGGSTETPTTSTPPTDPSTAPTTAPSTNTGSTSTPPPTATGQVSISINGTVEVLAAGATFPSSDPAFELVAIEGNTVKIGLANGSFSSGAQTITLEAGTPVTLISQPDGARYTIKLISIT